jgi:hypothetical protein
VGLRRCADLEVNPPEDLTDEELDRLQTSIDRACSAAQRTLHRSLKELRRLGPNGSMQLLPLRRILQNKICMRRCLAAASHPRG